jgi:OTU-like cysteine protease
LYGAQTAHAAVRDAIVTYVIEHWNLYSAFVIGNTSYTLEMNCLEDYLHYMGKEGVHGGEVELTVAAIIFKMIIYLIKKRNIVCVFVFVPLTDSCLCVWAVVPSCV